MCHLLNIKMNFELYYLGNYFKNNGYIIINQ